MKSQIEQLKRVKNAVILAHYYAPDEAQEIADFVGDSFYLAKKAKTEGLTQAEKEEQAKLRREYLDAIRRNMRASLGNPEDYKKGDKS